MIDTESTLGDAVRLNEEQRRAVGHDGGPLMVLAGPGTGKTRVIIERIAALIRDRGAEPASILAVTFTVKAAEQMRCRLAERLAGRARAADAVRIRTFHGFGREILQRFGDYLGLPSQTTLMDSAQRRRLMRSVVAERGLFAHAAAEGLETAVDRALKFLDRCRQCARTPGEAIAYAGEWGGRLGRGGHGLEGDALTAERVAQRHFAASAEAFAAYETVTAKRGLLSFDDFIVLPIRLLRTHAEVAAIVRSETRHVVVDEFQDVNPAQIELLRLVAPPERNPDLCVVGDDDQSIYAFRGADPRAMKHFRAIWPGHRVEKLEVNYRSRRRIIETGNAVVAAADRVDPDKQARLPEGADGDPGSVECVLTAGDLPRDSALASMILLDRQRTGGAYSKYAVLVRNGGDADRITAGLRVRGVPVTRRVKRTPLDDPGVQDVLSWVRILTDAGNTADVQRLLTRPPASMALTRVSELSIAYAEAARGGGERRPFIEWLRDHSSIPAVVSWLALHDELTGVASSLNAERAVFEIIRRTGVAASESADEHARADRVQSLVMVVQFARRVQPFLDPPGDLRAWLSYYGDLDGGERDFSFNGDRLDAGDGDGDEGNGDPVDAVTVLTAHRAKGLEFDTVFVVRCHPGWGFPTSRGDDTDPLPAAFSGLDPNGRKDEERRVFYVACTRAERRLVLTTKPRKAKGASSSTNFVDELRASLATPMDEFHEDRVDTSSVLGDADPMDQELSDAGEPETDARASILRAEFARARQAALSALHEIERATDGVVPPGASARLTDAAGSVAALAHLRAHGQLPGELGEVSGEERTRLASIAERISAGLGPVWPILGAPLELSYSKIYDYRACPRCFLLKHVLGMDEPKTEELSVGHLVHAALERYFKEWRAADAEGSSRPGRERLLKICEEVFRDGMGWGGGGRGTEAEYGALLAQMNAMAINAAETLHEESANILHIESKVRFPYMHEGIEHRITAKIDRVDQLASGQFRIVDYKTGQSSQKLLEPPKSDLQMGIYALAMPWLLEDPDRPIGEGGVAEYWLLRTAERGVIGFDAINFEKVRGQIDEAIAGILAGDYSKAKGCRKGLCELTD